MAKVATKAAPRTITREEPAARAPQRTAERDVNAIMTRDGRAVDLQAVQRQLRGDDRYDLVRMGIKAPDGWVYEWRTVSIKGAPANDMIADDERSGWTPVPASRHPGTIMPTSHDGPITLGGSMLKERDIRLTDMSRAYQQKDANRAVLESRNMAGAVLQNVPNANAIADFSSNDARAANFIRTERVPMGDPNPKYTYSLEE